MHNGTGIDLLILGEYHGAHIRVGIGIRQLSTPLRSIFPGCADRVLEHVVVVDHKVTRGDTVSTLGLGHEYEWVGRGIQITC